MMKLIKIFILLIMIWGCKGQLNSDSFISLDYSAYKGFYECIRILNNGEVIIYKDLNSMVPQDNKYYRYSLDKEQMDRVSNMIRSLKENNLDSIYYTDYCDNCRIFSLIVNWRDKILSTSYHGEMYALKDLNNVYDLVGFLEELSIRAEVIVDTTVYFESKRKLILPPLPDEVMD